MAQTDFTQTISNTGDPNVLRINWSLSSDGTKINVSSIEYKIGTHNNYAGNEICYVGGKIALNGTDAIVFDASARSGNTASADGTQYISRLVATTDQFVTFKKTDNSTNSWQINLGSATTVNWTITETFVFSTLVTTQNPSFRNVGTSATRSGQSGTVKWTITYNANGHGTAPASQTKLLDQTLTLRSSVSGTYTGYNLLGWATNSSATTPTYGLGEGYTSNSSKTLYAVWAVQNWQGYDVYLYDGSSWQAYDVYIYDGSSWVQYEPYISQT